MITKKCNWKTDLQLAETFYSFSDRNTLVAAPIPDEAIDFQIVYRAEHDRRYTVSRTGGVYKGCKKIDENTLAVFIPLSRYPLGRGPLLRELYMRVPNNDFEGNIRNICVPADTKHLLWDGPTDNDVVVASQIITATILKGNTGDSAYEDAVQHGYEGTEEQYALWPITQGDYAKEQADIAKEAESVRDAAERSRAKHEQSRELAETSRADAERGRVEAEIERKKLVNDSVAKADASAEKAASAAEEIMQLPIVRTDLVQEIAADAQAKARENISAVGFLSVVLTLAGDNTLSVASTLETLSAHYKLYTARPEAYRWSVLISGPSGVRTEAAEAEAIPGDETLHLLFRSQVLGQTYDLALTIAPEAVTGAEVAPWRRTEQAGSNTTEGGFLVTETDLNKYAGDRGVELFFRTGADVSTRQHVSSNSPLDLLINQGLMYVSLWGLWSNSVRINPDRDYHVVISFDKEKLEESLYINGRFNSSRVREDVPPIYSTGIVLGRMDIALHPFKGTIYHTRLFNFAPTAEDAAVLYNNDDPAGYIVPAEMKSEHKCIAEYLPQNTSPGAWLDSAPQLPVNGHLPPLWQSAGGYDLVASGTPETVYKSGEQESPALIAEVLAYAECSLEARIARLEKALLDLTAGRIFIPKLTVKELEVWGGNNLILTGEGAPSKAPDRAGQIYIDTKNHSEYRSTGNGAVSDWKNA